MALQTPRDIVDAICRRMTEQGRWADIAEQQRNFPRVAAANRRNANLFAPLPDRTHVEKLIEVAFAASVSEEEGRRTVATLGFLSHRGAVALKSEIYAFQRPLDLTPTNVAKLAPAADPDRTILAVWPNRKGELSIWGLVHLGDKRFAIDLSIPRTFFSVQILGLVTFRVWFDSRLLGIFVRDHWNPRVNPLDLLATLRDRAGMDPMVARELCRIARRMLEHKHGGTILVVDSPPAGLILHRSYSNRGGPSRVLADAYKADERAHRGQGRPAGVTDVRWTRMSLEIEKAHEQALDLVSRLSAVDGAVVLKSDLTIVGFGATIVTDRKRIRLTREDPREPKVERPASLAEIGGNRHRSAIHFCARQRGLGLAIVASQDGDISLFARRKDRRVHVLRPFEMGAGV